MHLVEVYPTLTPALTAVVLDELRTLLPKPAPGTNIDEARKEREDLAMSAVAALYPADTFEAILAVQIIAADAHAKACLRAAAQLDGTDDRKAMQCRAQASSMMRQMQSGYRALQRRQTQRKKDEAAERRAELDRTGYCWRDVSVPADPPAPEPAQPKLTELSEEELYATMHPERAAEIRLHGGVPPSAKYGPPEPELVDAIVRSTSPIMLALDQRNASRSLNLQAR